MYAVNPHDANPIADVNIAPAPVTVGDTYEMSSQSFFVVFS